MWAWEQENKGSGKEEDGTKWIRWREERRERRGISERSLMARRRANRHLQRLPKAVQGLAKGCPHVETNAHIHTASEWVNQSLVEWTNKWGRVSWKKLLETRNKDGERKKDREQAPNTKGHLKGAFLVTNTIYCYGDSIDNVRIFNRKENQAFSLLSNQNFSFSQLYFENPRHWI